MKRWIEEILAELDFGLKTKAECTYGFLLSVFGLACGIGVVSSGTFYGGLQGGTVPKFVALIAGVCLIIWSTVMACYFLVMRRRADK